jgi:prephenate dehydrogenase
MTSIPPAEPGPVAVLGTGLIGTSVAMACRRAGVLVTGWDPDAATLELAARASGLRAAASLAAAVEDARVVVVAAPIAAIPDVVEDALEASADAVVTDAGSIKAPIAAAVGARRPDDLPRFVPGHPMGGSERSGPGHASAHVVDGIVWALTPTERTDPASLARVEALARTVGARPVVLTPDRHDRLVAVVSHLPQVASTALMGLAAQEEADEPDLLLLAAGGFRDLTRLAASNPVLWSEILDANADRIADAIDLYVEALSGLRDRIARGDRDAVRDAFASAKHARMRLAAKPQVRAGVAVLGVEIPDEPGALASITATVGAGGVNIEDLQIVHSAEGGRGQVHLTVASDAAARASEVLAARGYDPARLA